MTRRVRMLGLIISPQILLDDGEHLTTISVNTLSIPEPRLDDVPVLVREALADLQAQLDQGQLAGDEERAPE